MNNQQTIEAVAIKYKALSDPTRLQIMQFLLSKKDCTCICKLQDKIKKDHSVLSRHIKILKDAGIIKTKKCGKELNCCLASTSIAKKLLKGY